MTARGGAWIVVTQGGRERLALYAVDAVRGQTIRWDRPIRTIETRDPGCATASGVHPGMRLSAASESLGGLVALSVSEIESREFAEFGQQAPNWLFRTDGRGIYAPGRRVTTNYAPQTVLHSVAVHD